MKRFIIGILLAFTVVFGFVTPLAPVYAAANPTDAAKAQVCAGLTGQAGGTCGAGATGGADIGKILKAVLNILSVIAGVAGIIMVIISGMRFITSSGDPQSVSGAKKTLIYAMVGLVVVAVSQLLVHFVLHAA